MNMRRRQAVFQRRRVINSLESRQLLAVDLELLKDSNAFPDRTGRHPLIYSGCNGVGFFGVVDGSDFGI